MGRMAEPNAWALLDSLAAPVRNLAAPVRNLAAWVHTLAFVAKG